MQAIPGGKATHEKLAADKIAGWLRGGLRPQAAVYPAEMRATRALLRRRMSRMRQRADLLTHVQQPNPQSHLPELGKTLAENANRAGVAERLPDPAGQQRLAVDRALMAS
jgi:hypothetical protein